MSEESKSEGPQGFGMTLEPLLGTRKHGLSTEQFPVCAYVGSSKNLKDLKELSRSHTWRGGEEGGWGGGYLGAKGTPGCLRHARVSLRSEGGWGGGRGPSPQCGDSKRRSS